MGLVDMHQGCQQWTPQSFRLVQGKWLSVGREEMLQCYYELGQMAVLGTEMLAPLLPRIEISKS